MTSIANQISISHVIYHYKIQNLLCVPTGQIDQYSAASIKTIRPSAKTMIMRSQSPPIPLMTKGKKKIMIKASRRIKQKNHLFPLLPKISDPSPLVFSYSVHRLPSFTSLHLSYSLPGSCLKHFLLHFPLQNDYRYKPILKSERNRGYF